MSESSGQVSKSGTSTIGLMKYLLELRADVELSGELESGNRFAEAVYLIATVTLGALSNKQIEEFAAHCAAFQVEQLPEIPGESGSTGGLAPDQTP